MLFEDSLAPNYGSFTDQNAVTTQADPQDVQRESEALQNIVSETSKYVNSISRTQIASCVLLINPHSHLVDIFATVPQNPQRPPATTYDAQSTRFITYKDVIGKPPMDDPYASISRPPTADGKQDADWLSDDEEDEISGKSPGISKPDVGPLLGGFADMERGAK